MRVRHRFVALVLPALVVLAACSNDDNAAPAAPITATTGAAVAAPGVATTTTSIDTDEPPVTTAPPDSAVLFEGNDFYAVPEPLPAGQAGTLLRYQRIDAFGGWSSVGDTADAFGLQASGTISGEVVWWRDPVAVRRRTRRSPRTRRDGRAVGPGTGHLAG